MSETFVKIEERIYSTDPSRPRYVMFYEGQIVRRSVLEELGLLEKPAAKARGKKDVEDKAVKPSSKA
jgi:hypothetical protein